METHSGTYCPICGRELPTDAGETAPDGTQAETLTLTYYAPRDWWVLRHVLAGGAGYCGRAMRTLTGESIAAAARIEFGPHEEETR